MDDSSSPSPSPSPSSSMAAAALCFVFVMVLVPLQSLCPTPPPANAAGASANEPAGDAKLPQLEDPSGSDASFVRSEKPLNRPSKTSRVSSATNTAGRKTVRSSNVLDFFIPWHVDAVVSDAYARFPLLEDNEPPRSLDVDADRVNATELATLRKPPPPGELSMSTQCQRDGTLHHPNAPRPRLRGRRARCRQPSASAVVLQRFVGFLLPLPSLQSDERRPLTWCPSPTP